MAVNSSARRSFNCSISFLFPFIFPSLIFSSKPVFIGVQNNLPDKGERSSMADRKFHNKSGPPGGIVLEPDKTVMIRDDAAHNGQTEAGPRFLGGKIRLEQPPPVFGCNPDTVIRNH